MASTSTTLSLSSSSSLIDGKALRQPAAAASPQCVTLPTLPPPSVLSHNRRQNRDRRDCRKVGRNVLTMATGDAPADVGETELPEIAKTIQAAWDKLDDKYAVTSLAFAVVVALWGSTGLISAIDRIPIVPGVLELVGIGYSGWFIYRNLIFKPDREALLEKIECTYKDIIGSS